MNNLTSARSTFRDQLAVVRHKHTWIMAWLYIGTFGSFIGYSAAFPLLIKTQFPTITANLAFLGPLVGSIARPLGGRLADRIGGARVTFWNFLVMGVAAFGVLYALDAHSFGAFLTMFLILFVTTGLGNGSTFRMIPVIFRRQAQRAAEGLPRRGAGRARSIALGGPARRSWGSPAPSAPAVATSSRGRSARRSRPPAAPPRRSAASSPSTRAAWR